MFGILKSALPVVLPLISIIWAEWIFFRSLRREEGRVEIFELGVFYSAVVLTYAVFPGIEFLTGGLSYSPLADNRLYAAQPSASDLAPIFWYYTVYLSCFVLSYRACRGKRRSDTYGISGHDQGLLWVFIPGYVFTYLFFVFLRGWSQ